MKRKKNWKDIKLYQYQELSTLENDGEELDFMINQLSIILDCDSAELTTLPIEELIGLFNEHKWIQTPPKEKLTTTFKLNGIRYGLTPFNKLSTGQLIDIEEYFNDGLEKNLHNIFAIFYLPVKSHNFITKNYKLEKYDDTMLTRGELFKELDMEMVYGSLLFFCHIGKIYLKNLAVYLKDQMKNQMEKMKMESQV